MNLRKHMAKRLVGMLALLFILLNVVAYFHAYKFTHFAASDRPKTQNPEQLSAWAKVGTLLFGVDNPRPTNRRQPTQPFAVAHFHTDPVLEAWHLQIPGAKGTVILFHGFSGYKSGLLHHAEEFQQLGYNTLLVDFMGSGGSGGNETTIGYLEAEQVKSAYDFLATQGEPNIYLFGTSMGAVAIMKAIHDHGLTPRAIVLECPFGSMYQTVSARFKTMNVPPFPMAGLLVFWGGAQHGFWAFGHNPTDYAKRINCPTLIL
jgi:uncharacterized protein